MRLLSIPSPRAPSPRAPRKLVAGEASWGQWTGVKIHGAGVSTIFLLYLCLESPSAILILGGLISIPTYLMLGALEGRRSPLYFSPLSFYFFWYSVGLGPSAIYMGNIASTGQWIAFSPPTVPPDDVAMGYLIFLAGSFALHAGLQWLRPIGSEDAVPSRLTLRGGRLGWLILLWAIGLWSVWSPEWVIPLGAPGRIFQWAPIAALSAFALTPRAKLGLSRSSFTFVLGTGTTGLFAANLMSYSKSYIMFSLIPLLWLFVVHRSLRRWLPIMGFAFVAFYLFVVAPIVMTARLSPLRPNESPAEHLANTFDVWRSEGIQFASNSYFGDQIDAFLMRQFDPIAVSFIIGEVKTYGLQLGSTAAYAAYAFIPRILWPEKPAVTRGAWFAYYVGFAPSEEESTMSLGITATGELYWNFGVAGVVVGMFTLGCLMGLLWRMAGADPRGNPLYMLLYVITMLSMVNMSEAVTVLVTVAVAFLTFKAAFIALSLLRRPDRRPHVVFTT